MSVSGIESIGGFTPLSVPQVSGVGTIGSGSDSALETSKVGGASSSFGDMLTKGIDHLEAVTDKSSDLSVKAATGDLNAIHDYTIAATETAVTTQLTVAMRNKAVEAFTEIMRMQI